MPVPQPSDDIPWNDLAALLAGELSPQERYRVDRWLAEAPEREMLLESLRQGWDTSAANRRHYDSEAALRRMKERAARVSEPAMPRAERPAAALGRPPAVLHRAALAASVAALLAAGGLVVARRMTTAPAPGHPSSAWSAEYRSGRGQRLALKLADGSSVVLGPASTLRLAVGYGKSARTVALEGAGYFEVTHDASRPFAVLTRRAMIRDLGTRFVVDAYPDERQVDVVVAEGRVAVGPGRRLASDSLVLGPGQRGRLAEAGVFVRTPQVRLDDYLDWTTGRLTFHDMPLPEALRRVGRWYNVRIRLAADSALAGRTVTASFRGEPAAEVVRLMSAPFGLRVEAEDSGFVLRR